MGGFSPFGSRRDATAYNPAMRLARLPLTVTLTALALAPAAWALDAPDTAPRDGEPQVIQRSTEDGAVRIDELRVRGQTRRLTVQPKIKGLPAYEIATPEPGRAPGQDLMAGQRIWLSLSF